MEDHKFHNLCFSLYLLHLSVSSFLIFSSAYTLPQQYFVNCGSDSSSTVNRRTFTGDANNSKNFTFSGSGSRIVTAAANPSAAGSSPLYQTARIFTKPSSYEFDISQNGVYVVRLHFYPFTSTDNLSAARFNVVASGKSLLSNFSVGNSSDSSPVIEEFLIIVDVGKFKIQFLPYQDSSFAFVNAVEAFLAPEGFIPDTVTDHVTPAGIKTGSKDLLPKVLWVIHRINVGGPVITPDNDTLWRSWVPDDRYLYFSEAARNSQPITKRPNYQQGGATDKDAPDSVYQTAKEMNVDIERQDNTFNISWQFPVRRTARFLVRTHFCDIVSQALSEFKFNIYIYGNFAYSIQPYEIIPFLAAPFYVDFVVDSDDYGFVNVSVGPPRNSPNETAFLNGLEMMELVTEIGSAPTPGDKKKSLFIILGPILGGLVLILVLVVVIIYVLRWRRTKPVEAFDWPVVPPQGGSSVSRITDRTVNGSPLLDLNLGLKLPFNEIMHATRNFDPNLVIGEGGFGKVYRGTMRDGTKVAIKRSEPEHGQGLPEFQTEIMVLSSIRHRHLVSLIGYCDERSEMILVYEFMEKGTLREHLYNFSEGLLSASQSELSWEQRLDICIGAAKGLHYLHTGSDRAIIHRDIKSTNILLDEYYVAKVADFGLSRSGLLDQTHVSTDVKGSFGYLDPEYFRCLQLTQKSDVYSFGVVLLEVLCARPAINNLLPREQINLADWGMHWQEKGQLENIVDPLLAGKIDPGSLRKFGETVEKCLQEYGVDRPNMLDVLWDLEYALKLHRTCIPNELHEYSKTDVSWALPLPLMHRLPSDTIPHNMDEEQLEVSDRSESNYTSESEVFSQLRMKTAR